MRSVVALAVITLVCIPVPLWSLTHDTAEALPSFWLGTRQMITAPLSLIASVGLGVAVAFASAGAMWLAICAAGLVAFLVGTSDPAVSAGMPSLAVIAVMGVTSISGWSPRGWYSLLFGIGTGAVAALGANSSVPHWDAALGLGSVVVVVSGWAAKILQIARSFPLLHDAALLARRIIGAWGTAIAILLAMSS